MDPRDVLIRTVIGEAAREGKDGWAAVAHTIMNRSRDPRWPDDPAKVALQPKQFSAWNKGAGGNDLVRKYSPGHPLYERVGQVVDQVMAGGINDPTGGATHYYSPRSMEALIKQGVQSNRVPNWWEEETKRRGGKPIRIGGHLFTGAIQDGGAIQTGGMASAGQAGLGGGRKVSDPALIARLEGRKVSDPGLLAKLEGKEAPAQSRLAGAADAFTQGATLGFGDELTALEAAVLGRTPEGGWFDYSKPFAERRQIALEAERGQQAEFAEDNPVTATAAELTGALATGGGLARQGLTLMGKGATKAANVGRGAAEGAMYGAVAGAGSADEGSRLEGAGAGAATGAAVGGAATKAGQALSQFLARRAQTAKAPSKDMLRKGADAAYNAARARNPSFDGFDGFVSQAFNTLRQEGFHPRLHPKVTVALDEFAKVAMGGRPDFKTLEQVRRIARAAAGSLEPDERRLGKMLIDGLDTYVERTSPVPEVKAGRELYGRWKRADLVDDAVTRAERRAASTGSGGNVENAIRQNIRQILDNPKKRRGFGPDELAAMEEIVRGGPVQNAMRLVGKLSPQGNGLMAALGLGATVANPLLAVAPAAGMAAKTAADRGVQRQVQHMQGLVRAGGKAAPVEDLQAIELLTRLLAMEAGEDAGSIAAQAGQR